MIRNVRYPYPSCIPFSLGRSIRRGAARPALLCSLTLLLVVVVASSAAATLVVAPFGPNGEGGLANGQFFGFGVGGQVQELDAFVHVGGRDLNGSVFGDAAQLSLDALPADLDFSASASASIGGSLLEIQYRVANRGSLLLSDLTFSTFIDAEIVETGNTFFNEYASVLGIPAAGQGFEVDEPGFTFGDIYDNLLTGQLDGTNAVPIGQPDDVSFALSFAFASLAPGEAAQVTLWISDAGEALPGVVLQQLDPGSSTTLTYSGQSTLVAVPEPSTLAMLALGLLCIEGWARRESKEEYVR